MTRHGLLAPDRLTSYMKWQYIILAAVFIGALALSLWIASHVDTNDIERGLTHSSVMSMTALLRVATSHCISGLPQRCSSSHSAVFSSYRSAGDGISYLRIQ
jgi:hypothetical protein